MAVQNSLDLLHPAFRARVDRILAGMRADGHQPVVFETLRSFERARELAKRGTGVARSMHCYGLAVDIVDGYRATKDESLWTAKPEFWASLARHADAQGCVWGGDFRNSRGEPSPDKPHVQAVPPKLQTRVRAASAAELDALVRRLLPMPPPAPAPAERP